MSVRFLWRTLTTNTLGVSGWIQGTRLHRRSGVRDFCSQRGRAIPLASLDCKRRNTVGLGARDTLRLEKGYLLSGVDFCSPALAPEGDDGFLAKFLGDQRAVWTRPSSRLHRKKRVVGHSDDDARWWGIKYTGKRPPSPSRQRRYIDGRNPHRASLFRSASPSLGNLGIGIGYLAGVDEGDGSIGGGKPTSL